MKFKSLLTVSLLLFSSKMDSQVVDAFRFPADMTRDQKNQFINKVGRLEKRFNTGKMMKESVKAINSLTG